MKTMLSKTWEETNKSQNIYQTCGNGVMVQVQQMTNQFDHKSSSNLLAFVSFWEDISDVGLYIVGQQYQNHQTLSEWISHSLNHHIDLIYFGRFEGHPSFQLFGFFLYCLKVGFTFYARQAYSFNFLVYHQTTTL